MGCEYFAVKEWGPSPQEAFKNAKKYYSLMYGHSGYTGTIADKESFIIIPLPKKIGGKGENK